MADATITKAVAALLPDDAGEGLTMDAVTRLAVLYPYFSLPAAMLLRDGSAALSYDERRLLTRNLARRATSPMVLATLLAEDDEPFYPDEKVETPSTEKAIDTFLSTYGNGSGDDEVLNKLIFNPAPDYAQLLAQEEKQNLPEEPSAGGGDTHDDLLNRFIIKQKQQEGSAPGQEPPRIPAATVENRHSDDAASGQPSDASLLSESLAKIFIRQKQYERAFEIISQLSLKYPEKSVYFADQMRFLRKLINNRRLRDGRQQ